MSGRCRAVLRGPRPSGQCEMPARAQMRHRVVMSVPAGLLALLIASCGDRSATLDGGALAEGGTRDGSGGTCSGAASAPEERRVREGVLRGTIETVEGVAIMRFLDVPYAAPPIEALRFLPPQSPPCFEGVREASTFGASCPQLDPRTGAYEGDEDCLHLNVWAPPDALEAPVLVFVHGGGNVFGGANETSGTGARRYDGARLAARHGAVVVTLNYRLGILGFLAHPELDAADPSGRAGTLGLLDQIAALAWVRDNIESFGGSPDRVLLFGESGGARDVCALLASPLAVGLFSAAMMQSGSCLVPPRESVLSATRAQIAASGCTAAAEGEIACLRRLDTRRLLLDYAPPVPPLADPVEAGEALQPHVDGRVLTMPPEEALASGLGSDVPFVVGVNSHESSILVGNAITNVAEYRTAVRSAFPEHADAILALYPAANDVEAHDQFVALTSDARFACPARSAARAAARGHERAVYRYVFAQGITQEPRLAPFGAYHGVELAYVFDSIGAGAYRASDEERALAVAVGSYWVAFGARGDPNGEGRALWPIFTEVDDRHLRFSAAAIEAGAGHRSAQCDFWDSR